MLQHWASEGEFYVGGFVLRNFIEPVTFACEKKYHIGEYLDTHRNL